jgi:hypothetical protein
MSRVEQIEAEIQRLSLEELAMFHAWFSDFDAEAWDKHFVEDVKAGKLDALAAVAVRDHEAGLPPTFESSCPTKVLEFLRCAAYLGSGGCG